MGRFSLVWTMAVVGWAVCAAPTGSQEQEPKQEDRYQFRVTVDLISLNVTVTDARSRFVTELLQKDFAVYEDGISQEISVFSREDLPIRMTLLLDTSASMDEKLSFAQEAAVNFVQTMKTDDVTEVMEFGSKQTVLQPFTADTEKLARAIRMTQAGGTTSLYNALYVALKNLNRRREDIRRQAIVVLSDGEDTSSLVTFEQVMELTKDTDVVVYTISLRRPNARRGPRVLRSGARSEEARRRDGGPVVLSERDSGARFRLREDIDRAQKPVQPRLHLEQPEKGWVLAEGGRPDGVSGSHRPHEARLLRASRELRRALLQFQLSRPRSIAFCCAWLSWFLRLTVVVNVRRKCVSPAA